MRKLLVLLVLLAALVPSVHAVSLQLSWTAPTTNADGSPLTDLAGYYVHYGTSPGLYSTTVPVGLVTTYQVDGLTAGVEYHFAVTAVDTSENVSTYSDEVSATPTEQRQEQELILSPSGDTFININMTNYVSNPVLATYTWPANRVANAILMKFNLTALPSTAVVQSAFLHLMLIDSDETPEGLYRITAHRLTRQSTLSQATGYRRTATANWTANACCYQNIPMAQADITPALATTLVDTTVGDKVWDVTDIITYWRSNPGSNRGLLLNSDATQPADRYRFFASQDEPEVTHRPVLVIRYTVP